MFSVDGRNTDFHTCNVGMRYQGSGWESLSTSNFAEGTGEHEV